MVSGNRGICHLFSSNQETRADSLGKQVTKAIFGNRKHKKIFYLVLGGEGASQLIQSKKGIGTP